MYNTFKYNAKLIRNIERIIKQENTFLTFIKIQIKHNLTKKMLYSVGNPSRERTKTLRLLINSLYEIQ